MEQNTLGALLRAAREESGLKSADICTAAGITNTQTLTAYEKGTRLPTERMVITLARIYGASATDFLQALDAAENAPKSEMDNLRLLVEAVSSLNLRFITHTDPYTQQTITTLSFDMIENPQFREFLEKWKVLAQLRNDGVITPGEYQRTVMLRLEDINN